MEENLPLWTAVPMAWCAVGMAALMKSLLRRRIVQPQAQCHADATPTPRRSIDTVWVVEQVV